MDEFSPRSMIFEDIKDDDFPVRMKRFMDAIEEFNLAAILNVIIISEYSEAGILWESDRSCLTNEQWGDIIAKVQPILQSAFKQRQIYDQRRKTLN